MKRIPKVAYTLEFKLEALRRVRDGATVREGGRESGVPEQSIRNWVKAQAEGKLGTTENGKPITPEQMEISRLRVENARLRMETEIVKKAAVGSTGWCNAGRKFIGRCAKAQRLPRALIQTQSDLVQVRLR